MTRHTTYLTLQCKQLMTVAAAIKLYIKMRSFHHHTHSLSSTEVSNLAELLCNMWGFFHMKYYLLCGALKTHYFLACMSNHILAREFWDEKQNQSTQHGKFNSYRRFPFYIDSAAVIHLTRVYFLCSDSIQILILALKPKNSYLFHYDYEIQHVLIPKNLKKWYWYVNRRTAVAISRLQFVVELFSLLTW